MKKQIGCSLHNVYWYLACHYAAMCTVSYLRIYLNSLCWVVFQSWFQFNGSVFEIWKSNKTSPIHFPPNWKILKLNNFIQVFHTRKQNENYTNNNRKTNQSIIVCFVFNLNRLLFEIKNSIIILSLWKFMFMRAKKKPDTQWVWILPQMLIKKSRIKSNKTQNIER